MATASSATALLTQIKKCLPCFPHFFLSYFLAGSYIAFLLLLQFALGLIRHYVKKGPGEEGMVFSPPGGLFRSGDEEECR